MNILDGDLNVVASQSYQGTAPRYEAVIFEFDAAEGEYVEVALTSSDCLSLSEVEVFGYSISPPPINLARLANVVASQSSLCWDGKPWRAIDGNKNQSWVSRVQVDGCIFEPLNLFLSKL